VLCCVVLCCVVLCCVVLCCVVLCCVVLGWVGLVFSNTIVEKASLIDHKQAFSAYPNMNG